MYSLEFMKFLVGRDAEDYIPQKEKKAFSNKDNLNKSKYVTVPIEIQK